MLIVLTLAIIGSGAVLVSFGAACMAILTMAEDMKN